MKPSTQLQTLNQRRWCEAGQLHSVAAFLERLLRHRTIRLYSGDTKDIESTINIIHSTIARLNRLYEIDKDRILKTRESKKEPLQRKLF